MAGEAQKIAVALRRYGRIMKLRRRVGTTSAFSDVEVRGISRGYKPDELVGQLQQGDRHVTISHAEIVAKPWPGPAAEPPKKGDFVVIDGTSTAVQGVETKYLGTIILAHVLWVRG